MVYRPYGWTAEPINGSVMRPRIRLFFTVFACLTVAASARDHGQSKPLTLPQRVGRRVFQQRCAVCHTPPMVISKPYGPALSRETVAGREGAARSTIMDGETGLMPGFRYSLEPSQVEAILEYLKTVEKPTPPTSNWVSEH